MKLCLKYNYNEQVMEDEMSRVCSTNGEKIEEWSYMRAGGERCKLPETRTRGNRTLPFQPFQLKSGQRVDWNTSGGVSDVTVCVCFLYSITRRQMLIASGASGLR
jgi:hypothetical protein